MAYTLSSFGPRIELDGYGVEFACTRFSSTKQGGSVFIFRPIIGPSDFFRGHNLRPGTPMQPMVVAGCVMELEEDVSVPGLRTIYVTLGIPLFASAQARDVCTKQLDFLAQIAKADSISAGPLCSVGWGSADRQYRIPTVVVKMWWFLVLFSPSSLQRLDTERKGVLNMRYVLVGGMYGSLRADQLRASETASSPLMTMLDLLQSYGSRAFAFAKYGIDFIAVRQRSIADGSMFAFKRLPYEDDSGYIGLKGHLWNYIGVMFGEVDGMWAVPGHGDFIRFKCPDNTLCSVKKLYVLQTKTLADILETDASQVGGHVVNSFFDYGFLNDELPAVPGCFYVKATFAKKVQDELYQYRPVVLKARMSRVDQVDRVEGALRRTYILELITFNADNILHLPVISHDYVCDENGQSGCGMCTKKDM
ncbi:hypothetical protein C8R47DRAFT_1082917 [Mycena vitilis]|nr:hypothetical protein C8R47DRAFT_1082917 [Mycena vitilis]